MGVETKRLVGLLLALWAASALAQSWPLKPIRLVVGYPPGGSGDFTTRIIGEEISRDLGVAVIVENKPGAGGTIASEFVSKAAADGYTVLNQGHHEIGRQLYRNLGYDGERDFVPVIRVANGATVLVVNNTTPFQTLRELIEYARAHPGKLFNAAAGFGSAPHLAACGFETAAGVKITSVQFKGGGPAAQSLIAGDTQMMFATSPTVMGFIKAGRMRPLAISMRRASPAIPGIPGAEEAGLHGYESTFWFGLYVPAGTPAAVVKRLHEAAAKGLARAEVREKIALQGMDAAPSASPDAFAAEIRAEAPMWERVIRSCGAKVE